MELLHRTLKKFILFPWSYCQVCRSKQNIVMRISLQKFQYHSLIILRNFQLDVSITVFSYSHVHTRWYYQCDNKHRHDCSGLTITYKVKLPYHQYFISFRHLSVLSITTGIWMTEVCCDYWQELFVFTCQTNIDISCNINEKLCLPFMLWHE